MTSEIRANTLKNRVGLGTVSFTNTGPVVSGIVTATGFELTGSVGNDVARFKIPDGMNGAPFTGNLELGNNRDFVMLHDGHHNYVKANNGNVYITCGGNTLATLLTSGTVLLGRDLDVDGHTNLDNVSIAGVCTATTFSGSGASLTNLDIQTDTSPRLGGTLYTNGYNIFFADSEKAKFGNASDLEIYHNGADNIFDCKNDKNLKIVNDVGGGNETMALFDPNGAVDLYHNGTKKFATDSTGFYSTNYGDYIAVSSNGSAASGRFGYESNYKMYLQNTRGTGTKIIFDNDGKIRSQISDGSSIVDRFEVNVSGAKVTGRVDPAADSTHDLGTNSVRWRNIYADTLYGDGSNLTNITSTTINNNANNRLITGSGTANTLEGEADLTFEKVNGVDPTFTFKRSSAASGNDNIYTELRFQNTSGTNMGQIICRRESSTDNAYLDFETKTDGENSQPSMRIKGQQGTAYFVGNLGRTNNNQPAYMSDSDYYSNTHLSSVNIQTRTNGGECGLFVRGRGQGGGSSAPHSCIRVDATSCANNADQYGIYLKGRQQLVSDTTGYYADVYGSYSTTYCFRGHLQKQIGAYTTGTTFHSKITQTSSGGASYHFRGYNGSSERIRIDLGGNVTNTNNSYGSLSDVKLKENIVDANSQWDDIKALKVRNFNFIDDPDKVKMLGLVAQEAESVSAGLVETNNDIEVDESTGEGKVTGTTKYLKYSILYMKAIKALQEAQTRIETLESKVADLEGS